ncbi:MBL fold metallo-hydrolase [Herbiconiux sp. YIM B11900]|uniref:MBL fold metallo-hydrolase n=1 Tax=Herbiconiux sp. YIM B11900 TaxID=3404131 RepID=UPI003F84DBB7
MRRIADRCYQLDHSSGANGYVVVGDGRAALIDPGFGSGARKVAAELHAAEAVTGPITDIVLTHYDPDHAGAAAKLQRELGAPVRMSAPDAAILRGEASPPSRMRRFSARLMRAAYPDQVVEFADDAHIFDGLAVVAAPGHTPGHVALQWGRVLFIGDAAMVSGEGLLRDFPAFLIGDKPQAATTLATLTERIRDERIEWICAGHSAPVRVRPAGTLT